MTEKPRFIKRTSAGIYVETNAEAAEGVAYKGTAYNLQDRAGVGAPETVLLIEFDAGDIGVDAKKAATENAEAIAELEDAMCEADANTQEWRETVEDALCEISAESEE